jgi:feruloyl esterase
MIKRRALARAAAAALAALLMVAGCATPPGPGLSSAAPPAPTQEQRCESLASASLISGEVTLAQPRKAGAFTPPGGSGGVRPVALNLPAFCRVAATLRPSPDSDIKMELWLPVDWNGKFMMVGNGAWSGAVSYAAMAEPLSRGYAVASTDTGHQGLRGTFAIDHPEKLVDFAWRAVHETTVKSKSLMTTYYGSGPKLAYWNGCSSGGKQGLKEAQRFPEDFNAMIVGAPANNWVRLQAQSLEANRANLPEGEPPILGPQQLMMLHKAVIEKCDALDGVADSEIADPRACRFEPKSLACKNGQDPTTCLSRKQVEAAEKIYAPVRNPKTKTVIFPGMPPGSEQLWGAVISVPWTIGVDTFAVLFHKPDWSFRSLELARDIPAAEAADPGLAATSADLKAFQTRGGKIIQYHGWSDALIPTENSINYYESVVKREGDLGKTESFYRLFLVPGMGHCSGAYSVDWISALEQWAENDKAPDAVVGHRLSQAPLYGAGTASAEAQGDLGARPICAYPSVAVYNGQGANEEPASYTCQVKARGAREGQGG